MNVIAFRSYFLAIPLCLDYVSTSSFRSIALCSLKDAGTLISVFECYLIPRFGENIEDTPLFRITAVFSDSHVYADAEAVEARASLSE